jgi:hypothetical protein
MSLAGALRLMMRLYQDTCYNSREQHSTKNNNINLWLSFAISRLSIRLKCLHSCMVSFWGKRYPFFLILNAMADYRSRNNVCYIIAIAPAPLSLSLTHSQCSSFTSMQLFHGDAALSRRCSSFLPPFLPPFVNTSLAGSATLEPPSYRCSSARLVLYCP